MCAHCLKPIGLRICGSKRHFSLPVAASSATTLLCGVHRKIVSPTLSGVFSSVVSVGSSAPGMSPVRYVHATFS